jgi:uncharacterized protein (DUF4415 family)
MIESSETTDTNWIDEDDAPDLSTPEWVAKFNSVEVRRGRPLVDKPKTSTTIRLDADIIARFREGGPGWQSRINAALREWLAQR